MTHSLPDPLIAYLAERDAQRADAVNAILTALTDRERALVKEAAVMGYVQGRRHPEGEAQPKDSHVLAQVIDACLAFHDLYPAINSVPAHACPPGCPGCNAPGGIGECGPEDRPVPAPRNALGAPHTAEPPAPGPEQHPGGENGPQTGTQRAELCRQFKDAITRRWDVAPFVIDEIVDDAVDCHLDLTGRAAVEPPAAEERRQRWEDTYRRYDAYDYPNLATIGMSVADAEQADLRAALAEVLAKFTHRGHPGEPCLQTGWISVHTVERWRAALGAPTPACTCGHPHGSADPIGHAATCAVHAPQAGDDTTGGA